MGSVVSSGNNSLWPTLPQPDFAASRQKNIMLVHVLYMFIHFAEPPVDCWLGLLIGHQACFHIGLVPTASWTPEKPPDTHELFWQHTGPRANKPHKPQDEVLTDPPDEPQLELVYTLENTSDSKTCWATSHLHVLREEIEEVWTAPNSILLLQAGGGASCAQVNRLCAGMGKHTKSSVLVFRFDGVVE